MITIHTTEVDTFLRCRRQWDLVSQNRQGLTRVGAPPIAFHVGSAIHHTLDAQRRGEEPKAALAAFFDEAEDRVRREYKAIVGVNISLSEMAPNLAVQDLAGQILDAYFRHYGDSPLDPYTVLESEVSFRVPIPGTRGFLAGTYDALLKHSVRDNERWVYEAKSFSNPPNEDDLALCTQFTLYAWAAERLFGYPVHGILYDGLGKRISRKPEGNFIRYKVRIPRASIDRWTTDLPEIYRAMASPKTKIYPTFGYLGSCWECHVRDLCRAIQFGEDLEYKMRDYRRGEGHRTVRALLRPHRTMDDLGKE
jgi:hypothetical protein